jgi:hypothetical protein
MATSTYEKKWENIERAIRAASLVEYVLNQQLNKEHIAVRLYVPGEHELLFEKLYDRKYVTVAQVLDADCDILLDCDGALFCMGDLPQRSNGMEREYTAAKEHNKPTFTLPTPMNDKDVEQLVEFVRGVAGVQVMTPKIIKLGDN